MYSKFYIASSSFFIASLVVIGMTLCFITANAAQNNHPTINLPPLNYIANLRPHLTHEQLNLHYNAHQGGAYVAFLKTWFESSAGDAGKAIEKLWETYTHEVRAAEIQFIQNAGAEQLGDISNQIFATKINKLNQSFVTFLTSPSANLPEGSKHKNFASQVYNHALYFSSMTDEPVQLSAYLTAYQATSPFAVAIKKQFGTAENFMEAFEAKALTHFASGWVWLGLLRKKGSSRNGQLFIMDTHDAQVFHEKLRLQEAKKVSVLTVNEENAASNNNNKFVETQVEYDLTTDEIEPLLVCDVWEHAYYVDYRQKRGQYIAAWFQVVDWARVDARYSSHPLNIEVRPHKLDDKERAKRMFNKKSESDRAATEVNDGYPHFV